jgi:hypothetical protein
MHHRQVEDGPDLRDRAAKSVHAVKPINTHARADKRRRGFYDDVSSPTLKSSVGRVLLVFVHRSEH